MGQQTGEEFRDLEQWSRSLCLLLVGQFGLINQLKVAAPGCLGLFEFAADYRGHWRFVCWGLVGSGLHFDRFVQEVYKVPIECSYFVGQCVQLFGWFRHQMGFDQWVRNFHYQKLYSMWSWNCLKDYQKYCWKNYLQCWHYCYDWQCLEWQCWQQ